jgi:ABC-type amino acid transport substrate-binding protein
MGRAQVARNMRELNGRRVAVAAGTTTVRALESGAARARVMPEVVLTRTLAEAFELLKAGKVDAIAGDRTALVGTYLLGGSGEGLTVFAEDLSYEPYALALRRGDEDFRLLVDSVLADLYRTGEIEKVYAQWLGPLGVPGQALLAIFMLNALPER